MKITPVAQLLLLLFNESFRILLTSNMFPILIYRFES